MDQALNSSARGDSKGSGRITELLDELRVRAGALGERQLVDQLVEQVYGEIRRLAARCVAAEPPGNSLLATDLAHEALLRLAVQRRVGCRNRRHLYSVAARIMRRILVDHARRRRSVRHGAALRRVPLDRAAATTDDRAEQILAVDQALAGLSALDPLKGAIVELRFFGGLSLDETASALGSSRASVHRHWRVARGWLRSELAAP